MPFYQNVYLLFCLSLCSQIFQIKGKSEKSNDYQFENTRTDWAFSPVLITNLAKDEREIYRLVLQYRNNLRRRIDLLERYNHEYGVSAYTGDEDVDTNEISRAKAISDHPLMTYRMIRRFVYNLEEITRDIALNAEKPLLKKVANMRNTYTLTLPTFKDVDQIIENILRLQNVYELQAKDLIVGIIAGRPTGFRLSMAQAYEIGKYALSTQMYTESLDWIQNIIIELRINPDEHIDIESIFETREQLIKQHNDLHDKITPENYYELSLNRFHKKIDSDNLDPNQLKTLRENLLEYFGSYDEFLDFGFMKTCLGINVKNAMQTSNLYCYLKHSHHPMWKLNPMKFEVHSWDPYVYQIYDAIGEKIIKYLQDLSVPILTRATVIDYTPDGIPKHYSVSADRTSSHAFLQEEHDEILRNLEKKVGFMTGLKVDNFKSDDNYSTFTASESIQVAVYGFGGHFSEHLDALEGKENETTTGDRLGSFMFYLNDVELGGYTAFPKLGISVAPIKGSALFWYDLLKSGEVDHRMIHGGCPVILGEKWIANKWIRHNANFRKRPCSLNSEK